MTPDEVKAMIRHEVRMHEIRFTLSGFAVGVGGLLGYLASQGLL